MTVRRAGSSYIAPNSLISPLPAFPLLTLHHVPQQPTTTPTGKDTTHVIVLMATASIIGRLLSLTIPGTQVTLEQGVAAGGRSGKNNNNTGIYILITKSPLPVFSLTFSLSYENLCGGRLTRETTRVDGTHIHSISGVVVQSSYDGGEDISAVMMTDSLVHLAINGHCIFTDGHSTASSHGWRLPLHHC